MNSISSFFNRIDAAIDNAAGKLENRTIKFNQNIIGSIVFIALSSFGLFLTPSQIRVTEKGSVNAQTFPKLLLEIILVCSIAILILEISKIIRKKQTEKKEINILTEIRALILLCLMVGYLLLLKPIGFILSSILFGLGMLGYFRIRKWWYYLIIIVAGIVIGLVFQNLLHVRLP